MAALPDMTGLADNIRSRGAKRASSIRNLWSASPPSDDLLRATERAFARHQTSREPQNKQEFARARVGT